MAVAAWNCKVKHATTLGGSYTAIAGIKSAQFPIARDMLDTSALKDDDGWRKFAAGLAGASMTLSGDRIAGDTQQDALRTAATGGTTVFLQFEDSDDGTDGFKGEFYIESFDGSAEVAGLAALSVTARMTGAPTALS